MESNIYLTKYDNIEVKSGIFGVMLIINSNITITLSYKFIKHNKNIVRDLGIRLDSAIQAIEQSDINKE